jgi:hypothetical protein
MLSSVKCEHNQLHQDEDAFSLVKVMEYLQSKHINGIEPYVEFVKSVRAKGVTDVVFTSKLRYRVITDSGGKHAAFRKMKDGPILKTNAKSAFMFIATLKLKWPTRLYYVAYNADKIKPGTNFSKLKPRFLSLEDSQENPFDPSQMTLKSPNDQRGKHGNHKRGAENGNSLHNRVKKKKLSKREATEKDEKTDMGC